MGSPSTSIAGEFPILHLDTTGKEVAIFGDWYDFCSPNPMHFQGLASGNSNIVLVFGMGRIYFYESYIVDGDFSKLCDFTETIWEVSRYHQSSFRSCSMVFQKYNTSIGNRPIRQGISRNSEKSQKHFLLLKLGPPTLKPFGRLSTTPGILFMWHQDGSSIM